MNTSVKGLGYDIVEIARIKRSVERFGDKFLSKIFTKQELVYCFARANPYPSLAARFAAKEALAKALQTGVGAEFSWKTSMIETGPRGEPVVKLDQTGLRLLKSLAATDIKISLSHTRALASAVVMVL
ncbi:MAG: holo-ACP synthase [Puniceicoccales bacterium]|jgi:holo-[acyl-carrier protein] synthase|nr:holo-ACP synthase [Puniceicoccales bacterium]